MGLCRFFPLPSDRMSIIWSLMPIKDAVVLEYGPAGTTHFGGGLYSSLGIELGKTLFTTHISEDDVVMGDVSRLENAIREVDEAYHPKVIFVVASAVVAVIGSDIAGVCQYMQEEVNARLISFEEGGFRGDYTYGLRSVYRMLAREIVEPTDEKNDTYNILGASAGAFRIRSDVWEIKNLMYEAFDMECACCMGLECNVSDIENMGKSKINLVLRDEALECARIISDKCGTDFVYGQPFGYAGTLEWLEKISKIIGREINPKLVHRIQEKMMKIAPMGGPMGMGMMGRSKPKAIIQGEYDSLLGFKRALKELDIDVETLICSHSMKNIPEPDSLVCTISKEKERIDLFRNVQKCWCLGSDEMGRFVSENNYMTTISAPFISKTQWATHFPYMGEKGMDYLLELKSEYFSMFNL